jgi:TonB family protein
MSEIQPSENDRQQRLAELQARLRRLTEERKAELRRSGPLPGDLGPPSAADGAQEQAVEPPAPVEAVAPAAPEMETDPVAPAVEVASEASTPQPLAPSPTAGPPADPQPSTPPPPEPLPVLETPPTMEASGEQPVEATPAAGTPRLSAVSAATSALSARMAMVTGQAKRAARALGRPATAKARARQNEGPSRQPGAQPRPDGSAANEESTEPKAKKKRRSLRAAALVGFGLLGGVAFMQFADLELSELLEGALPAAETDQAGSTVANAASSLMAERNADPVTDEPAPDGSVLDGVIGPVETVPAEIWAAPPVLEISSPDAADVTAVEVDLALLEPAASEPTPITSSSALPATGNPTERPTFIPYDVPPKLENPGEIQRLLERGYPSQLRDAGIEGTVILWIFVDDQGAVQKTEVKESSGYEVMDEAALSTAEKMSFSPAMNRDKATPVWLAQPITFR